MSHHRVKNPCKICSQSVNNKTGLQCKGACRKWSHFTCLGYDTIKIEAIKAGELTIICPCPNCTADTNLSKSSSYTEKHWVTDVLKSLCPKGKSKPDPCAQKPVNAPCPENCPNSAPNPPENCGSPVYPEKRSSSPPRLPKEPKSPPIFKKRSHSPPSSPEHCGSLVCLKKRSGSPPRPAKEHTSPLFFKRSTHSPPRSSEHCGSPVCPENRSASPPCTPKESTSPPLLKTSPHSPLSSPENCGSPLCPKKSPVLPPCSPKESASSPFIKKRSLSPPSTPKMPASPSRTPDRPASRSCPAEPFPVPPTPTPTAVQAPMVKGNFKGSFTMRKIRSCSCGICPYRERLETGSTSDTMLTQKSNENQRVLYCTIEQLCNTVGLLSTQIKEIIGKLVSRMD